MRGEGGEEKRGEEMQGEARISEERRGEEMRGEVRAAIKTFSVRLHSR